MIDLGLLLVYMVFLRGLEIGIFFFGVYVLGFSLDVSFCLFLVGYFCVGLFFLSYLLFV